MGWLFPPLFITLALAALWRFGKLPIVVLQVSAAALLIAAMGYAWQGSPNLGSAPAAALSAIDKIDTSQAQSHPLKPAFTREDMALNTAAALLRAHNTTGAVFLLQDELRGAPHSASLWVALGQALIAHNGGLISPAAEFAFDRAKRIAPQNPGPDFFRGLAAAQAGRLDEANAAWQALLARTPPDAPWRKDLEARLAQLRAIRTAP
jgi:cytochrome c-type biogenesis protein CcmH/NrfG